MKLYKIILVQPATDHNLQNALHRQYRKAEI